MDKLRHPELVMSKTTMGRIIRNLPARFKPMAIRFMSNDQLRHSRREWAPLEMTMMELHKPVNCSPWRLLRQLLGITQRTIRAKIDLSNEKFSPRKLIPVTPRTIGDYLILKRFEAGLSQAEVAAKVGIPYKALHAWEHDHEFPTDAQLERLNEILSLADVLPELKTRQ
jgi:DNA-binding XRE family transcriptional regulator